MAATANSTADLYLAFRQAKCALFFEKRGVGMAELAEYEEGLPDNLRELRRKLRGNRWFDGLEFGQAWIVPKRFHSREDDKNSVTRIGANPGADAPRPIDIQVRVSPHPEFAIAEVLYLWQFGPLLESLLSDDVVGYRLDLRGGEISKHRRWLFEYWPKSYQKFRSAPLEAAKKILEEGDDAIIMSADLANFYDTVDPSFLLSKGFLKELRSNGATPDTLRSYKIATGSLLRAYEHFRVIARTRLLVPVRIGIPIGALTSRIIANVALSTLDRHLTKRRDIVSYRRYVDDLVIVGRTNKDRNLDQVISHYLPLLPGDDGIQRLDSLKLDRVGSELEVQKRKIRVHHVGGDAGADFLEAVASDFTKALSERRAFIDTSTFLGDGVTHLIRASNAEGSPLRVLREADRTRLERFALSTSLRSLERVTSMIDHLEAKALVRSCLERVGRVLDAEDNWVDDLDTAFRFLKLAIITGDWESARELRKRMDRTWGTAEGLRKVVGEVYYRGQKIDPNLKRPWLWLRNYLHERRLEAICCCLPIGMGAAEVASRFPDGLQHRRAVVKATALRRRAELLASADLRARDREEDRAPGTADARHSRWMRNVLRRDATLRKHLAAADSYIEKCFELGDRPWLIPAARLYLCTRPPSYFDIARRWLYRMEESGFGDSVFEDLLEVVNGVRGTNYSDPVGHVLDPSSIYIEGTRSNKGIKNDAAPEDPRVILGNLVVDDQAWVASATRVEGSTTGTSLLSKQRLHGLVIVLEKAERAARKGSPAILVLPELSLPRQWLRIVASHVVRTGRFGLVTGLEYFHFAKRPHVANQVVAVLPGPCMSVATWPWTKRLPAREEGRLLSRLEQPVAFAPPSAASIPRTTIHSGWGSFSVLVCSELIEARRVADLLGRAQIVLCPAWNTDTSSYDHLIQSVGFQLHAIVAVANNGHYSDCRVWAPRTERWERDLCRLIERDVNDVVHVDIPVSSLANFHSGDMQIENKYKRLRTLLNQRQYAKARIELDRLNEALPGAWRPLPPDWPD